MKCLPGVDVIGSFGAWAVPTIITFVEGPPPCSFPCSRFSYHPPMSWEAFRWTAKSPSELYHVLGPHGVDDLIRQALAACWRDLPDEQRSFKRSVEVAREVHDRNVKVWRKIKQPTPESFFADLGHTNADG